MLYHGPVRVVGEERGFAHLHTPDSSHSQATAVLAHVQRSVPDFASAIDATNVLDAEIVLLEGKLGKRHVAELSVHNPGCPRHCTEVGRCYRLCQVESLLYAHPCPYNS